MRNAFGICPSIALSLQTIKAVITKCTNELIVVKMARMEETYNAQNDIHFPAATAS